MGDYERTVDQLPSLQAKFASKPIISGKDGGHTLNLHQFARDGVTLLGKIQGVRDHTVLLAQDLKENLARADQFEADFVKKIDKFIHKSGMRVPEETLPTLKDGYDLQEMSELDLAVADVGAVIWATGYSFDFSLVKLPIFDADGYPIQQRGITEHPGLYFVGLPWLHNAKSGLLFGLAQDASHIAAAISDEARRRRQTQHNLGHPSSRPKEQSEFGGKSRNQKQRPKRCLSSRRSERQGLRGIPVGNHCEGGPVTARSEFWTVRKCFPFERQ